MRLPTIQNNESKSICGECGQCCKSSPGGFFPKDFGPPESMKRRIKAAIKSRRCVLDYWEGGSLANTYYVRPAIKGHEGKVVHAGWGGEFTFFTEGSGCSRKFDDRPYTCRALKPVPLKERERRQGCKFPWNSKKGDKEICVIAWKPYQQILESIIEEVDDTFEPNRQELMGKLQGMLLNRFPPYH